MTPELLESIKVGEGFRAKPYYDTLGNLTIGYGTLVANLVVSKELATEWIKGEVAKVEAELSKDKRFQAITNPARRDVLVEMAYNIGVSGLMKFTETWKAIEAKDWDKAANQMLTSKWAKQVKGRAIRLAQQMRDGEYKIKP